MVYPNRKERVERNVRRSENDSGKRQSEKASGNRGIRVCTNVRSRSPGQFPFGNEVGEKFDGREGEAFPLPWPTRKAG